MDERTSRTLELIAAYQSGDRSVTPELVELNIGIVHLAIKKTQVIRHPDDIRPHLGVATIAMIESFAGYKFGTGVKWSTYAMWCMMAKLRQFFTDESDWRPHARRKLPGGRQLTGAWDGAFESPTNREPGPGEALELADSTRKLREFYAAAMASIPNERWRTVLDMRMHGMTFLGIGSKLGCTRERVRQIETKALQRLRRNVDPNHPVRDEENG